jgi:hypothetical protein
MKIESIFWENEGKNLENCKDKFTQNPNKITMIKKHILTDPKRKL